MPGDPETAQDTLKLEVVAGTPISAIVALPRTTVICGRSSQCDTQLPDNTISRRHFSLTYKAGAWLIADLESRHGTYLNGIKLEPNATAPIRTGDLVRCGQWTFRARIGDQLSTGGVRSEDDLGSTLNRVQKVPEAELGSLAQQRLELLIECAASINTAASEDELATAVLDALLAGTGFPRAMLIRSISGDGAVDVVGFRGPPGEAAEDLVVSQSLIQSAKAGEIVRMSADGPVNYGESIVRLGIHSALCAPVMLDGAVAAFIYLDARNAEQSVQQDAAAFCQAIARMCGLAFSNIKRAELKSRHDKLLGDVQAAGEAQRLLMPPSKARVAGVDYVVKMRPGRYVAGDLFNIITLPDGRLAAYLGDVSGKGVGAAILMATVQTHLKLALREHLEPAKALDEVNQALAEQGTDGRFVSLWVGIFDPAAEKVYFVDAGHGHWLVRLPGEPPKKRDCVGGMPLGIDADIPYETEVAPFVDGSRLIVFSDGVVEQTNPEGEEFQLDRTIKIFADASTPEAEVEDIFRAVLAFAQTDALADDVTVASLENSEA